MRKALCPLFLLAASILLPAGCVPTPAVESPTPISKAPTSSLPENSPLEESPAESPLEAAENRTILLEAGGNQFTAALEENAAAAALLQLLEDSSLIISLQDYGGFEKVGGLGQALPTSDRELHTQAGDIVLYRGDQIVLFYGSNTWRYTPLAHVQDLHGWTEALGAGDLTLTISRP